MTKNQYCVLLDEILGFASGTIKGDEELGNIPGWDSLAIMAFISMLDERLGESVPASKITSCRTVADLIALAGEKVEK